MSRLRHRGPISRAVIATVLVVALGIAASIALARGGGSGTPRAGLSVRFPTAHRWYDNRRWFAGCRNGVGLGSAPCGPSRCRRYLCRAGRGVRGAASDANGIAAVLVSVRRDRTRRYRFDGTFSSTRPHYVRATLTGHGTRVQWFRWLGLPRVDGWYTVRAVVIPRGGTAAHPAATATAVFAVDHAPPPPPRLVLRSTGAQSVRLVFSHRRPHETFRCRLDNGAWRRCRSPRRYVRLSGRQHVFAVRAVDRYGRYGPPAQRNQPASEVAAEVTITGRPAGLLYPAAGDEPIPLRLANPGSAPITVTGLSVGMQPSSLPQGCQPRSFQITQSNLSASNPIRLGPYRGVTLPYGDVTAPRVRMIDTHTNQDACEGGRLALTYAGRAHQ